MSLLKYRLDNYGFYIKFKVRNESDGTVKDLTGLDINFRMWLEGTGDFKIDDTCVITDATHGECIYLVKEGDFDETGTFNADLEFTKLGYVENTNIFNIEIYGDRESSC